MPIGMSFCGFLASSAVVETASKPMYEKNITPAPRRMPLQPNSPKCPSFGGMNGTPIGMVDERDSETYEEEYDRHFYYHDHVIEVGGLTYAITRRVVTIATYEQ